MGVFRPVPRPPRRRLAWPIAGPTAIIGQRAVSLLAPDAILASTNAAGIVGSLQDYSITTGGPSGTMSLVFFDDFTSTATIDMANAQVDGFNWYREQWWGNGTTNLDNISQSGTVLTLGGGTGRGRLQSAIASANPQNYIGNGWGGGAFFEARMKFNPTNTNISGTFGIYLFSLPHIYDNPAVGDAKWPGQAPGYSHFTELDMFELSGFEPDNSYNGHHTFQGTVHDWSGTYNGTLWQRNIYNANSLQDVGAPPDWTAFHTYGVLWVPRTGTTPGFVRWYFDGAPLGAAYWIGQIDAPPLPGEGTSFTSTTVDQSTAGLATRTFAILDRHQLAMQLDGNPTLPILIDWIKVWR